MKLKKFTPGLAKGISEAGYNIEPRQVQLDCIPKIKSGADLTIISPDGSGKSTTLAIALIQQLKRAIDDVPRAIVMVADMEKALELEAQFKLLGKYTDLRVYAAYEQGPVQDQKDLIYKGLDILIGTPKRIQELINISGISTMDLKHLVVDDAELVFQDRHHSVLHRIAGSVSKFQYIVFASSYKKKFVAPVTQFMKKPILVTIEENV
jgi:superfamily II DNA/RNA helicase